MVRGGGTHGCLVTPGAPPWGRMGMGTALLRDPLSIRNKAQRQPTPQPHPSEGDTSGVGVPQPPPML